jgi:type III pantothenate kinase
MDMAISIGNSNIRIAANSNHHLKTWRIAVDAPNMADDIANDISLLQEPISRCIVSSVKPDLTATICDCIISACSIEPIIAALETGFLLDYSCYKGILGIDRPICCEAAYLQIQTPFIVVDLGTATTLNVVDCKSRFVGGLILPGVQMGLSALYDNTALLPHVQLQSAAPLIGQNTKECILAGAVYGTALLLDSLIARIWSEIGVEGKTIVTGGSASGIIPAMQTACGYDEHLIIKGLFAILDRIKGVS